MKRLGRITFRALKFSLALLLIHFFCKGWIRATDYVRSSVAEAHASIVESVAASAGFVRPEPDLSLTDAALIAEREAIGKNMLPALARAVVHTESRGKQFAISPVGAIGLMQIMIGNLKRCGLRDPGELLDKRKNIKCGIQILDEDIRANGGNPIKGLQNYNGGPNAVRVIERCGGDVKCMGGYSESYFFAQNVLAHAVRDLG